MQLTRLLLTAACLAAPLFAQSAPVLPPGTASSVLLTTDPARVAVVDVALKQQDERTWSVTILNESALQVVIPRARILIRAPSVSQLIRTQVSEQQSNSAWAVLSRTGQELTTLAPAGLSAAGIATGRQSLGWYGLGLTGAMYLVQRAQARATPVSDELPELIPLAAGGGAEYRLHAARQKTGQPAVTFSITVVVP